mmetsp:Transcript_26108/g.52370  ORF Transcript_26108/g.52370 Transcript_26108/m.52370 type:complete len:175 (-) Transcript_26108:470-994(-)
MREDVQVLDEQDRPISQEATRRCTVSKISLNFSSDNMKENCKLSLIRVPEKSPLEKEDIARILVAHLPLETLLLVRGVHSHLRHFVNEETWNRLNSDSTKANPDLNCRVRAMHGEYAVRRGCRSLKTLLLMQKTKEESVRSTSSSSDEESFDLLCLCAVYGNGSCTHCRGYGHS